jgi:hypothetical protein
MLLMPSVAAAQGYEVWAYDRNPGQFRVLDAQGNLIRTIPFAWPRAIQFLVAADGKAVYFAWGTNGWDQQTWKLDVDTGTTSFLFANQWAVLTGWSPGSTTKFLSSGSFGEIWEYDTIADSLSVWQDNDQLAGQVGFNTFRYELSFTDAGKALVRAGYASAGGDGLFLADVCTADATHHLCNLQTFSNPGGGSSSWSNTAGRSYIDPQGRYAFYLTGTSTYGHQYWRRNLANGSETLLPAALMADMSSPLVFGDDYLFSAALPASSNRAIYACDVHTLACRTIALGDSSMTIFQVVGSVDTTAPSVVCSRADGAWHPGNVSLTCTASDSGSGLANEGDSMFMLSTNIPDGVETPDALTDSRTVCDRAGNCTEADPIGGNKIDRRAPAIALSLAPGTAFVIGAQVPVEYACTDDGSGVASCLGTVSAGAPLPTATAGSFTFAVAATDVVGHTSGVIVPYVVSYGVCLDALNSSEKKSGATLPVKFALCDAAGRNKSSPDVPVVVVGIRSIASGLLTPALDSGTANPGQQFRYADGQYIFSLSLKGVPIGAYLLEFAAGQDPQLHTIEFRVR